MDINEVRIPRKTLIAGIGVGAAAATVAACSSSESGSGSEADPGSGSGDALAATSEVPVGSGVIVGDVIVTQPVAGDFQGFSAVCTHTGCLINNISDGTINCPCHGSKFDLEGQVVNGPAARPLEPIAVEVQGDSIVQG